MVPHSWVAFERHLAMLSHQKVWNVSRAMAMLAWHCPFERSFSIMITGDTEINTHLISTRT